VKKKQPGVDIFSFSFLRPDLREDIKRGVYIENATEELVSTPADAFKVGHC